MAVLKRRITGNLLLLLTVLLLHIQCSDQSEKQPEEKILVSIWDQASISVNEFIRRAEYTPRPDFCKGNTYVHKKIILNSLIAEKLLALEAGKDCPLYEDDEFQRFIRGRKEQAMRQWMYHQEAVSKVKLDSTDIKNMYNLAGREYDLSYYTFPDSVVDDQVCKKLTSEDNFFEHFYTQLTGNTSIPQRTVKFSDRESEELHRALFSAGVQKGQTLNPIKVGTDDVLVIKVNGWQNNLAMTEQQRRQRLDKVKERLTQSKASAIWKERVALIMKGKRLDFNADVFYKVTELFFPIYFRPLEEEREQLINKIWGKEERQARQALDSTFDEDFLQQPFFTVGGQTWTVADFRSELMSHPLVFRHPKMDSDDFAKEFRLAIADLVRDHYVTKEAYKKGYDNTNIVQRNAAMWRDTFVALHHKHEYLDSVGETRNFANHYHDILKTRLNPYIDSLQQKYYKKIKLDFETFENISLTSIDLFVKQPAQPFKYVVPLFPVITTDNLIEYITRMYPEK